MTIHEEGRDLETGIGTAVEGLERWTEAIQTLFDRLENDLVVCVV